MTRIEIHELLKSVMKSNNKDYSKNVYYQPPESLKMNYPAIVYERTSVNKYNADNITYLKNTMYQVTVIDKDPDSFIVEELSMLSNSRFNRHFVSDNLNHDVFTIY